MRTGAQSHKDDAPGRGLGSFILVARLFVTVRLPSRRHRISGEEATRMEPAACR